MSIAHLFEEFATLPQSADIDINLLTPEGTETLRLEAYEEGYKAGWEDAIRTNQAENTQIAADLAQNLKDLSVTFEDAGAQIARSLKMVFQAMTTQFLPEVAQIALAPKVAEQLEKLPLGPGDFRLNLSVAPENRRAIERLVESQPECNATILDDPILSSGQVLVGFDDTEMSIDFDALLEEMKATLSGFQKTLEKEEKNV